MHADIHLAQRELAMPRILIIVIVLFILLAGAAVAVMQQLELGPFAPKPEMTEIEKAEAAAKLETFDKEAPAFIELDPLVIPIVREDRIGGSVQLQIQIETKNEHRLELLKMQPRISDAFIRDLYGFIPRMLKTRPDLDLDILSRRLVIIGERAVGPGYIDNVLIQSIVER